MRIEWDDLGGDELRKAVLDVVMPFTYDGSKAMYTRLKGMYSLMRDDDVRDVGKKHKPYADIATKERKNETPTPKKVQENRRARREKLRQEHDKMAALEVWCSNIATMPKRTTDFEVWNALMDKSWVRNATIISAGYVGVKPISDLPELAVEARLKKLVEAMDYDGSVIVCMGIGGGV
jgi:hypothetical protein